MNRCASCRHWRNPWEPTSIAEGHLPEEQRSRWGTCDLIQLPGYGEDVGEAIAFTADGSDYRSDLHTRDDFGCVLWADS